MGLGRMGRATAGATCAAMIAGAALAQAVPPGDVVSTTTGAGVLPDFQFIYGGPVNPPFTLSSTVSVVRAARPFLTIRTFIDPRDLSSKAGQTGGWVMPIAELRGLTRAQVLDRWALPIYPDGTRNNRITLALVPAGTLLWSGEAGPIRASIDGTGDWGAGGGTQYYVGWGAAGVSRYQLALSDYVFSAPLDAAPVLALGPRLSGNAGRLGSYLDGLSPRVTPFSDLDGVLTSLDVTSLASPENAAPLAEATDQLSPDRYAAQTIVAGEQRRLFLDALSIGAGSERGFWKQLIGQTGRHGDDGTAVGFKVETWGAMTGLTLPLGEDLRMDAGLGYLTSRIDWRDTGSSSGRSEAAVAGLGLRYAPAGAVFASAQLIAGYGWSNIDRRIVIADTGLLPRGYSTAVDRTARGEPHGVDVGARAQAGLTLAPGGLDVRPFAGIEYGLFDRAAFTETGAGAADLQVDQVSRASLHARAGLMTAGELGGGWSFDAGAVASRRLSGSDGGQVSAGLAGMPGGFTVTGVREDAWLFEPSAGLKLSFDHGWAHLGYRGELGQRQGEHAATAELAIKF